VHGLAPVPPRESRAGLAAATGEHRRDALVLRPRPEDRPAEPRVPLDADAPGVNGLVGLEVIDDPADAPGPGTAAAPLVRRPGGRRSGPRAVSESRSRWRPPISPWGRCPGRGRKFPSGTA